METLDMSLDDIISKRNSEKRVIKKPLKFSPGKKETPAKGQNGRGRRKVKATSGEVAAESGKMKREAKIAAKRGLGGKKQTEAEINKAATAKVKAKKTVVNLAAAKTKRGAAKSVAKKEKPVMELAASSEERAVKVKDFTLPKDTKMVITFEPTKPKKTTTTKKVVASTTGAAGRRKNAEAKSKAARAAKVGKNRGAMDIDDGNAKPNGGSRRRGPKK